MDWKSNKTMAVYNPFRSGSKKTQERTTRPEKNYFLVFGAIHKLRQAMNAPFPKKYVFVSILSQGKIYNRHPEIIFVKIDRQSHIFLKKWHLSIIVTLLAISNRKTFLTS